MKWAAVLALLASFALYAPSLDHFFVSDDFLNIERNRLRTLADVAHVFATGDVDFYRPIPRLHFGLMSGSFGGDVVAWNVVGVFLHGVAAALAALLVRDLLGASHRTAALFTGLFFAVHFVHAEAVVWASGITSVYDAIFGFATILLFRKARRTGRVRDRVLTTLAFACALLSKESAVALIALIPLTTWFWPPSGPDGRPTRRLPTMREATPWLILLFGYIEIVTAIDRGGALSPYRMSIGGHVVKNLAFFVLGSFVPVRYWEIQDIWSAGGGLLSFAAQVARHAKLLVPLSFGALALLAIAVRGGRDVRTFLAWIGLASLPHLLLPGSGERFLYVPSFGACAILGLGAAAILRRRARWPGRTLGAASAITILFALHVAGSLDRQGDWSTAGKWTRGIVGRWSFFQALDSETSIEFVGIPARWGSAWVFRNGFDSMVRLRWEGRDYWREEERPPGRKADQRMGVVLHPGGSVGMLPAHLLPERSPWPTSP